MTTRAPLPKRLLAQNGQVYSIELVGKKAMRRAAGLEKGADDFPLGMTLVQEDRILLLKMASDAQTRLTLWHEVLHVAAFFGATDGHGTSTDGDRDEIIVSTVDSTSLDLMRMNPEVLAYLLW